SAAGDELSIALRGIDGLGERSGVFVGDAEVFDASPVVLDVQLPSGHWKLAAAPRTGWPPFRPFVSSYFLAGCLLASILSALLFQTLRIGEARRRTVAQLLKSQAGLRRSHRALRLYSKVEQAVLKATDEAALLADVCRVSIESAGYRTASVL